VGGRSRTSLCFLCARHHPILLRRRARSALFTDACTSASGHRGEADLPCSSVEARPSSRGLNQALCTHCWTLSTPHRRATCRRLSAGHRAKPAVLQVSLSSTCGLPTRRPPVLVPLPCTCCRLGAAAMAAPPTFCTHARTHARLRTRK
jgi:hypothetical protein